jgi:hypothetical protein
MPKRPPKPASAPPPLWTRRQHAFFARFAALVEPPEEAEYRYPLVALLIATVPSCPKTAYASIERRLRKLLPPEET